MVKIAEANGIKTQGQLYQIPSDQLHSLFDAAQATLTETPNLFTLEENETYPENAIFRETNPYR